MNQKIANKVGVVFFTTFWLAVIYVLIGGFLEKLDLPPEDWFLGYAFVTSLIIAYYSDLTDLKEPWQK